MLSPRYYNIVHKTNREDYMQSLSDANELDKNDLCYSTYAVKIKKTLEVPILSQLYWIVDQASEFDDNNKIQVEEDDAQPCTEWILLDILMEPSRLTRELKMVDLSSQILLQGAYKVSIFCWSL